MNLRIIRFRAEEQEFVMAGDLPPRKGKLREKSEGDAGAGQTSNPWSVRVEALSERRKELELGM